MPDDSAAESGRGDRHDDLEHLPMLYAEIVDDAMRSQEPVTEVVEIGEHRTLYRAVQYDPNTETAWRADIDADEHPDYDNKPNVQFSKCSPTAKTELLQKWTSLATGSLSGPQKLPAWESLFTVFNAALGLYQGESRDCEQQLATDGGRANSGRGDHHVPPKFQGTATKSDFDGLYVLTLSGRCSCGARDWGLAPDWKVPAEHGGGYLTSNCPECLGTMEHSEQWERVDRVVSDYSELKPRKEDTTLVTDGGREAYDPAEDPQACSLCGVHIGAGSDEYCDGCAREIGAKPPIERCMHCGSRAPQEQMDSVDISTPDEYYPTIRYLCRICSGGESA